MTRYHLRFRTLAAGVAVMAGYVDAIGFLKLGGLFVSFMSGNSTRLAVGMMIEPQIATTAARLIAGFVIGVVMGTLLGMIAGSWRKVAALSLVALLLTTAAWGDSAFGPTGISVLLATAMGTANTIFQRDGEVTIGVTYMTGTLVKCGQRLAGAFTGGPRWAWLPYLVLWGALVLGAGAGAFAYPRIGDASIWLAVIYAAILTLYAAILGEAEPIVPAHASAD